MSVLSFVTAFVTSAVLSRPKADPKDIEIKALKSDVAERNLRIDCLLHTLAGERDERIELRRQIAEAESAIGIWRARADMQRAYYNGAQAAPPPTQEQAQQQQVMLGAQDAQDIVFVPRMSPMERLGAICMCVPGRSSMFNVPDMRDRSILPRNQFAPDPD